MNIFSSKLFRGLSIFFIAAITLFFSTYKLIESPAVWFDEGFFEQAGMNLALHGVWGIQTAPHVFASLETVSAGFPLLAPLALVFKIFGVGVLQARSLMVVFIACLVGASFLLIKREAGFFVAAASALLVATFPVLYGDGKTVIGEVPGLFYFIIYLLFLSRSFKLQKKRDIFFAGLFLGIFVTTKISFLLAGLPAALATIIVYRRHIKFGIQKIILCSAAFLSPLILWIVTQFGKTDSWSVFIDTTFRHYETGPAGPLFVSNVIKFFTEISPLYLLVCSLIWIVSIVIRLKKQREIPVIETNALFFCALTVGIFLLSPGWYRYFFPAQIITFLFLPNALLQMFEFFGSALRRHMLSLSAGIILLLAALHSYQTGFKSFVADYYHSNRTARMQQEFAAIDTKPTYFIYNVPEVVIFLPNINYYQYANSHIRHAPGLDRIGDIARGVPDRVIVYGGAYKGYEQDFALYQPIETIADRYLILARTTKKQ